MDGWSVQVSRNRRAFQKYFSNLAQGGERQRAPTPSAPRLPAPDARIRHARVGAKRLTVTLRDGRLVSVPLWLIPKLGKASAGARQARRSAPGGCALEWPQLGLRLTLAGLLAQKL